MLAIIVLSIAIVVVFYAFTASMRVFTEELAHSDASFETHKAVDRMTKELRRSLEIVTANPTDISFWHEDTNNNGSREADETVEYIWVGSQEALIRTTYGKSIIISNSVTRLSLTYDNPSNVRVINISITAQKGESISTLESSVKPRNL